MNGDPKLLVEPCSCGGALRAGLVLVFVWTACPLPDGAFFDGSCWLLGPFQLHVPFGSPSFLVTGLCDNIRAT